MTKIVYLTQTWGKIKLPMKRNIRPLFFYVLMYWFHFYVKTFPCCMKFTNEKKQMQKCQNNIFPSFYPIWRILNLDQRNLIDVIMSIFLIIMRGMLPKRFKMCIGNQCNFNLKSVAGLMHFLRTFETISLYE